MKITDLIDINCIQLELSSTTKSEVIDELASMLAAENYVTEKVGFINSIMERENHSTTGIGSGIAIPHAKCDYVIKTTIAFGLSKEGIEFESLDDEKAHLFFMIAAKSDAEDEHLKILSYLARKLIDDDFREKVLNVSDKTKLFKLLEEIGGDE